MTPRRKKGGATDSSPPPEDDMKEGWEGLSEDLAEGTIAPSPELEEALREASEAVGQPPEGITPAQESGNSEETEPESLEVTLAEAEDRFLRLQAEFENFRRRSARERAEAHRYGHQNFVKDLLPTVDNLERAIDHAKGSGDSNLEGILQGVELVLGELKGVLGKHGVSVSEAENEPFDPAVHEAVGQVPDASQPPNTVIEVLEKGYQLHDRMLRPARVIVSKTPGEDEGPAAGGRT